MVQFIVDVIKLKYLFGNIATVVLVVHTAALFLPAEPPFLYLHSVSAHSAMRAKAHYFYNACRSI
jgi:hypothetical protein